MICLRVSKLTPLQLMSNSDKKSTKVERFLVCENPRTGGRYVLCTRPMSMYRLPDFELIFGEQNVKLKERIEEWYSHVCTETE